MLAFQGGQYFLPEESGVRLAMILLLRLYQGQFHEAAGILAQSENPGYILMSAPGALVQLVFSEGLTGVRLAAALLSLYSAAEIAVVFAIVRKIGGDEPEALLAAFFMAASTSLFYYARHFVPYDASMLLALLALWLSLEAHPAGWRVLLSGVLLAAAVLVYSGSGMACLVTAGLLVIFQRGRLRQRAGESIRRAGWMLSGGGLVLVAVAGIAVFAGVDAPQGVRLTAEFSNPLNQTTFQEGWLLPWQYFWHTEHGLLILWFTGFALAVLRVRRTQDLRGMLLVGSVLALYGLMAGTSSVLEKTALYGRLVRELLPFLVLAAAYGIVPLLQSASQKQGSRLKFAFVALVMLQTAINFYPPLAQRFPDDLLAPLVARYQDTTLASTVLLEKTVPVMLPASRYVLVNMSNVWSMPVNSLPVPAGKIVFSSPHPFEYRPYQYEGYSASQRHILDSARISMMVIDRQEQGR